jgi:hypothetical protein
MTDTQADKKNQLIRKRCLCCKSKFTPDPRVGQRQKYCSEEICQSKRLRLTKYKWLEKEENKRFRQAQQRRWRKLHREYLRQWRQEHPESIRHNRENTRERMRRQRRRRMFEKSIEWRSQVNRSKGVIYTNRECTMILVRLKRGSGLSKAWGHGYAYKRIQSDSLRLPQGRLYKVLKNKYNE